MGFKGNRDFIEALKKTGDVVVINKEVDWDMEAGAIVRRTNEMQGPAVLFENVKDYPGKRLFGSPLATYRRVAIAMGLDPDIHYSELFKEYQKRMKNPIKPVMVKDAPCHENIITGDDVDLCDLPVPMVHDGDGGRYIGTWHFIAVKDPDSDWVNWGMYRLMIHNRKTMGGLCLPYSDQGRIFYNKYVPFNKPMPFSVVIGTDPLSSLVALAPIGIGINEVDYAGALNQEPIELVKSITNDIPVPAHAEIVIEGEVLPQVTVEEGPFGEYTGYRSAPRMPRSVYRVKAITYRNNPMLTLSNMGVPVDDCAIGMSLTRRGEIENLLLAQGIPITGVHIPPVGVDYLVVVGVKKPYNGIANQIGNIIFGSKFAGQWEISVIVVDDDVDPYNLDEVIHAWQTKCHPARDIIIYDKATCSPLTPFATLEERMYSKGAKVVYDCTWPLEWDLNAEIPQKSSFRTIYPKEIQEKVLKNWTDYGFKN